MRQSGVMRALDFNAVGRVFGLAAAWLALRFAQSQLSDLGSNSQPLLFACGLFAMVFAAMLAAVLPAWRAARIDPMVALRNE